MKRLIISMGLLFAGFAISAQQVPDKNQNQPKNEKQARATTDEPGDFHKLSPSQQRKIREQMRASEQNRAVRPSDINREGAKARMEATPVSP